MRSRFVLQALLWGCLAVAASWAAEQPRLLVDLPAEGPMSATVKAVYTALQPHFDISWVNVRETTARVGDPAAVVLNSSSRLLQDEKFKLDEFVRRGGGLVFIASTTEEKLSVNNQALGRFGVRLALLREKGQGLKLMPHAVTQDVGSLPALSLRYGLQSDALEPVVMQNGYAVAMAGMVGVGRLVVLPSPLLIATDESRAADAPQSRLLARAIAWAAGNGVAAPGSGMGAGEASSEAPVAANLAPRIVMDLPELPKQPVWAAIAAAVKAQLVDLSLPLEPLEYAKGAKTLQGPLQARPALVVLSSYRELEDAEMVALAEYVHDGGSVLVIGYGDKSTVKQVAGLNKALGEFGITYILGRPAGQGILKPHPITQGLPKPGVIAPGGSVWAFADWPLLTVDTYAVASAHEFQQGRLVLLDGYALAPPTEKQPNSNAWCGGLLRNALRWLTGK